MGVGAGWGRAGIQEPVPPIEGDRVEVGGADIQSQDCHTAAARPVGHLLDQGVSYTLPSGRGCNPQRDKLARTIQRSGSADHPGRLAAERCDCVQRNCPEAAAPAFLAVALAGPINQAG